MNAMVAPGNLLEVRDLAVDFRVDAATTLSALKGVSFDIPERGTVALVGESGSGKSVTALAMLGLLPGANAKVLPGSRIVYRGRNLLELAPREMRRLRGAEISMVFQEPMTSLNPVLSIGRQMTEGLIAHGRASTAEARRHPDVLPPHMIALRTPSELRCATSGVP